MRRLVLVGFLAASLTSIAHAQATTAVSSAVSVLAASGQGEAKVTPDRVSVLVNVQTRGATAALAASDNAKRTQAVFDAMARLGLPKDQVTTEGYTVYPEMQYPQGAAPKVTGYVATNTVRVESHKVDQAGQIIDASLAAGANLINGVSFYASSIETPRREAIAAAVASARADAEAMARAAGGTVGELIELTTAGPTIPPRPMFDMVAKTRMDAAAATPMNPGQQTVSVFITGRWRFVQGR